MSEFFKNLEKYGVDIVKVRERFLDDEDFYVSCFNTFMSDENFDKFIVSFENKNYKSLFEYGHALKGVAGNLGLTPLYEALCSIVDKLRMEDYENLEIFYSRILAELANCRNLK